MDYRMLSRIVLVLSIPIWTLTQNSIGVKFLRISYHFDKLNVLSILALCVLASLLSALFFAIVVYFSLKWKKNALISRTTSYIDDYVVKFFENLKDKPELGVAILLPIVNGLINEFSKDLKQKGGSSGDLGAMLGGSPLGALAGFAIPKKYQPLLAIAQLFMGGKNPLSVLTGSSSPSQSTNNNPLN